MSRPVLTMTAILACLFAGLTLAACGGGSSTTSSQPTGTAPSASSAGAPPPSPHTSTTSATTTPSGGSPAGRPSPSTSTPAPPAPAAHGAEPVGAAGILHAKKVPAAVTTTLQRFTACMRSSGVPGFPEPQGAGFNLSATHLNPSSPQYKAAEAHCTAILEGVETQGSG